MASILHVDKLDPQSGTALEIGTSGDTITIPSGATIVNSGTATGFGGGKILQAVTATDSTSRGTTSTSYVTASNTLTVDITPAATTSKIWVLCQTTGGYATTSGETAYFTLYRDGSNIGPANGMADVYNPDGGGGSIRVPVVISVLDSPSSTSSLTYQLYAKGSAGAQVDINWNNTEGNIIALEIGA